ncbi:MAG: glycosyltransferase [Acidimicrobiia bacterium]|nr:glycosyltransferase [Acidimicrobiia bacterium]
MRTRDAAPAARPIEATVMVLTHNSAATLDSALESVSDFAEIIVCDGASSDATRDIAIQHGATLLEQDSAYTDDDGRLLDYGGVRHQVVQSATKPWIFHLDADEIATPELTEAIAGLDEAECSAVAFRCSARHLVGNVPIRSAANYPMLFTRVFHRESVTGYHGPINEHPMFNDDAEVADIAGEFLIPLPPLRTVLRKWVRYQRIIARDSYADAVTDPITQFRQDLRVTRWLAWRIWKTHRVEPGPHMPMRYDLSRVGFHLASSCTGLTCRVAARLFSSVPSGTAS